jgi:RNA polymerase sigma factor (sigma-70 family)
MISIVSMPPETSSFGFAEFLSAYAPLLESLYARSNAGRWNVPSKEFAAALYRSTLRHFGATKPAPGAAQNYFEALHLEELALACALRGGCDAAWQHFLASYRPLLQAAARAIVGSGGEARAYELADSVYAELYGLDRAGGTRKNSLLDYFHGRSKLVTWLRAVLAQRHVDALRVSQRTISLDDEKAPPASVDRQLAYGASQNIDLDRERLLPCFFEAVSECLAALSASDRLLLSFYYVQELTLAQIARLRGVHEATISRRLQNIRVELRQSVESVLARGSIAQNGRPAAKALSPAEIRRCFDYVLEDGSFDLNEALAEKAVPARGETK